jgi:single-strand DNA-binding protein
MNRATIIGNLTKDPELKTTGSGVSVCTFAVAVRRPFSKDETDFIPVVTWRELAENCAKFLSKGRKVGVSGRIQTRNYETSSGERRYVTEIIADEVEFITPKGDSGTGASDAQRQKEELQLGEESDFEPLDDEQMPF